MLRPMLAVLAVLVLAAPASAATVQTTIAAPAPVQGQTQGIIMRDGGVCDPIRHMGC